MAKKPRYIPQPGSLVEVSNRTVGSRFLLKPSKEARELMAGVLARAARKYPALVVFWVCLSNHWLCAATHKKCYVESRIMWRRWKRSLCSGTRSGLIST